jgi:large subunit ribosomal protein L19e
MTNLENKKKLASKVFGVGKNKIYFDQAHIAEIKEAITKQDMRDLFAEGIIAIKSPRGRMSKPKRTTRRGPGKIKMTINIKKRGYIIMTRKLRRYISELRKQGKLNLEKYGSLRKKIRARTFKNKAHIRDYIGGKV